MTKITKGLLLGIDANSLLHRAYHAYPLALVSTDGRPVNAVYGFTSMLLDVLLKYKPEYVFCAFDTHKPTFRHADYIGYKANRPKTDSELVDQIAFVDDVLNALNIPIIKIEGYEADDILGTISHMAKEDVHGPVSMSYILTGDRDLFQLVEEKIRVIMPKGSFKNLEEYGDSEVMQRMGVSPSRITDLKGLMGDASDNIPGVKGVGPKTAADLINTYGTLTDIFKNLDAVSKKSKRLGELLAAEEEIAVMSQKLATIVVDAPINFTYEKAVTTDFSMQKALSVFTHYQFKSLIPRLKKLAELAHEKGQKPEEDVVEVAQTGSLADDLAAIIESVKKANDDACPLATEDLLAEINNLSEIERGVKVLDVTSHGFDQRIENLAMLIDRKASKEKVNQYIAVYYNFQLYTIDISSLKLNLFDGVRIIMFGFFPYFNDIVSDGNTHAEIQAQEKLKSLMEPGILLDVPAVGYALAAGRGDYDIDNSLLQYGISQTQLDSKLLSVAMLRVLQEQSHCFDYEAPERVKELWEQYQKNLGKNVPVAVHEFEDKPALLGVALMHLRGIGVNTELIIQYSKSLEKQIADLEKAIFSDIGFEFNIRSTKQLGDVLFQHLNLPALKKTKTGFSTDDEVLQELAAAHPAVEKVVRHRQLSKLLNTYIRPFLDLALRHSEAHQESAQLSFGDNTVASYFRIHSEFNPLATSSGRLSSTNPNLQNLPIKTEEGKAIRAFFVAEKGYKFMSFDYSQIDLRVMAHISGDTGFLSAFTNDEDIHRTTASKIFNVEYEKVGDKERRIAKTVNFGLLYGMSAFGLSKSIGLSVQDASRFMKAYFESFPAVQGYMEDTVNYAKKNGYVISLLGRRRYIYGLDSNAQPRRMAAQREAINMPIQGGSDDIMRLALGAISQLPEVLSGRVKLVLQIHDELVFEIEDDSELIGRISKEIKEIMESVIKLAVPLKVGYSIGKDLTI